MKTKKISFKAITVATVVLVVGVLALTRCSKKSDSVTPVAGTLPALVAGPIPGGGVLDTSWTLDQVHSGMCWNVPFQNVTNTNLTGKFTMFNFGFNPNAGAPSSTSTPHPRKGYTAFYFDPNNLQNCYMNFWLQMSTFNTGQPGRDGYGGCGPSYVGVVYYDSLKTKVDPHFDTARFVSTSFVQSGTGYLVSGNFTWNHYRPGGNVGTDALSNSGAACADSTPITHPLTIYLNYNGQTVNPAPTSTATGKYWAGFSGTTSIYIPAYVDPNATTQYYPYSNSGGTQTGHYASVSQIASDKGAAANNRTYGDVSSEVGSTVSVSLNCIFYKTAPVL